MNKILVADPDPSMLEFYKRRLADEGYEVICASSAEQTICRVREERPEMVLMDFRIAGVRTSNTLIRLLKIDENLPVILMSGRTLFEEGYLIWLSSGWVIKSPDIKELKDAIQLLLVAKKPRKQQNQGYVKYASVAGQAL